MAASAAAPNGACACEGGPLLATVTAAVREQFPQAQHVIITDVQSQPWGRKHVVVTLSTPAHVPNADAQPRVGVHVFGWNFETLLRTLDVFIAPDGDWPSVERTAADSVVIRLTPEKGERPPNLRRAYEWRSIEGP